MVAQAYYVEGVLHGVVGVDPVCIAGSVSKGRQINPGCSKTKQLGQDSAGEARKDGIRGRDHNERKKRFSKREGRLPIHHGKW